MFLLVREIIKEKKRKNMKKKNNCDWICLESESDMIDIEMMDNGYWEYVRLGIGVNDGKVFMVDLDDIGEDYRRLEYCDKVGSVEELIDKGIKKGVFVDFRGKGYDKNDDVRWNMEGGEDRWREFLGEVSSEVLFDENGYYSFL